MKWHMSALQAAWLPTLAFLVVVAATCRTDKVNPTPSSTAAPLPAQVVIAAEPDGVTLEDPRFDPLPGAQAYYGQLGGTVYRIEIPDSWNGTLVLYLHGVRIFNPIARAENPPIRSYLIRNGYAWGASSFGSNMLIPGRAADETAALWDHFASEFGRPKKTYVYGESMGGAGALISAERYGNRYDGVFAMCAYAGQSAEAQFLSDVFSAAAFAAGVTQAEFDARAGDVAGLVNDRIVPALNDAARHQLFEDILMDLTGGPRPFDREGLKLEEANDWGRMAFVVALAVASNADRVYELDSSSRASSEEFNQRVVRLRSDPEMIKIFIDGNELTGDLEVPTLTVHTTGDMFVPISQEQILRRKVDDTGKDSLLAQQAVQAPNHVGFVRSERERGLQALIDWVEHGKRPPSEDVLVSDLTHLGEAFTLAPRFGSAAANLVDGASERITVEGQVLLDGKPLDNATIWVQVLKDGLWQSCSFPGAPTSGGRYARVVAADVEVRGCGASGARLVVATVRSGRTLVSSPVDWPAAGGVVTLDVRFSTSPDANAAAVFTRISGDAMSAAGTRLTPGTEIAAYVGDTLCGRTSIPYVPMQFGAPDEFSIVVVGPEVRAGCAQDEPTEFKVNGAAVSATVPNSLDGQNHEMDLVERSR